MAFRASETYRDYERDGANLMDPNKDAKVFPAKIASRYHEEIDGDESYKPQNLFPSQE